MQGEEPEQLVWDLQEEEQEMGGVEEQQESIVQLEEVQAKQKIVPLPAWQALVQAWAWASHQYRHRHRHRDQLGRGRERTCHLFEFFSVWHLSESKIIVHLVLEFWEEV